MSEVENQQSASPPPEAPPPQPPAGATPPADQRQWAMIAHLSALVGLVVPFGNIIGPLIVWLVKKDEMAFVNDQGKEALNFQITVAIAVLVCLVLFIIFIGVLLLPLVGLAALVFTIIGGIKANEGVSYRYPLTIRLIK